MPATDISMQQPTEPQGLEEQVAQAGSLEMEKLAQP